jgi:hypothetical protein
LKIPSKKLLNSLIEFADKDKNNIETFEKLLICVDFKDFDKDKLKKIAKKSKYIII